MQGRNGEGGRPRGAYNTAATRASGIPRRNVNRRPRASLTNTLTMGPAALVENLQQQQQQTAATAAAAVSTATTNTTGPTVAAVAAGPSTRPSSRAVNTSERGGVETLAGPSRLPPLPLPQLPPRSTRIQRLRAGQTMGASAASAAAAAAAPPPPPGFATPSPAAADISTSLFLDFGKKKNLRGGNRPDILSLTPNSSTLWAAPAGSSPAPRLLAARGRGRKPRSSSRRGASILGDTSYVVGDAPPIELIQTPSRNGKMMDRGTGIDMEGNNITDGSISFSPKKLKLEPLDVKLDVSEIGFTSIESIDVDDEEDDESYDEEDDEEEVEWGLDDRIRLWRHDAMAQHLYETAIFWGDKVLSRTNDPSDAFWLAQAHFQAGEYARAERLLTRPFPVMPIQRHTNEYANADEGSGPPTSALDIGLGIGSSNGQQQQQQFVTPFHPQRPILSGINGASTGPFLKGKDRDPVTDDPFLASASGPAFRFKVTTNAPVPKLQLSLKGNLEFMDAQSRQAKGSILPPSGLDEMDRLDEDEGKPILPDEVAPLVGPEEIMPPEGMEDDSPQSRLVDMSVMCRYLAAQCQVRLGKWTEALEMLGEENPFRDSDTNGPHVPNQDGGLKLGASMCLLRGTLYMRLNRVDRAKTCLLEALALDVRCFEAYNVLIRCQMLTVDEEWELVEGLRYKEQQNPEEADFIRLMYTARLKKLKRPEEISLARRRLTETYGLGKNCDLLYTLADSLYAQLRFADCFVVTSRIMDIASIHLPTIPLHIACMYHLKHLHSRLFLLAHELVDKEPESPMSWYAVGVWYLATSKWREAKQYLSKTTLMDSRHAPGWVAFAHTFAKEGEHEHAITAYSTCARLFRGSHLPHLFIGMEQIMLSHVTLAHEALETAYSMCDSDPLVYNERGVVAHIQGEYEVAVTHLEKALELAKVAQAAETNWVATYCNLGSAYRKLGKLDDARKAYERVLTLEPRHATALASLGMVYHMCTDYQKAIQHYHEALSVEPLNSYVLELLNMALISSAEAPLSLPELESKVAEATQLAVEKKTSYMTQASILDAAGDEKVPWDMPNGLSAWTM